MVQDPKEVQECSQMIYKESRRLLSLIDDVLRLSRLEEAAVPFEKMDLFSLSKEIISTFEAEAQKRQVTLLMTGQPAFLEGNSVMLEQMVANLCENAIKYNHPGGSVSIAVEPTRNGMVRFCITDTGIGIPDEHKERVFERFYRVDKSRSKQTGGTGLGLSIVKHAVERHGGKISLQSQEGEGTTISVLLPSFHSEEILF